MGVKKDEKRGPKEKKCYFLLLLLFGYVDALFCLDIRPP